MRPVRRHEVGGLHRAQRDDPLVGAAVAHHADRLHRQEHREGLRRRVVPVAHRLFRGRARRRQERRVAQLLDEDRVGPLQQRRVFTPDLAEDTDAEAGPGERVTIDHLARQAERDAEFADLVLEQFAQRLQQLQVQRLGQAADVVMALDRRGLLRAADLVRRGLDDVRVDRALREPLRFRQLRGLGLEHPRQTRGR